MAKRSSVVSLFYKGARELAARMYYLRADLETYETYQAKKNFMSSKVKVSEEVCRQYKKLWGGWSCSSFVPRNILEVCSGVSGVQMPDYLPDNVYFTTIDPLLNDKQMAWGYSEKGSYARLYGIDNEPVSIMRNMNGLFCDFKCQLIQEPEDYLTQKLKTYRKILVKPSIDSWGGHNVLVFQKNEKDKWCCINDEVDLSLKNLQKYYSKNYTIQEYVEQHPFYKKFNPSSFNTFRIYVYRSPVDEKPHVLQTFLRVGGKGSVVDNLKSGGVAIYVNPDGTFRHGFTRRLEKIDFLPNEPSVKLTEVGKALGLESMHDLVMKLALKMPYTRLVAFDINIDVTGSLRLIELNASNIGMMPQFFGVSFFGPFTQEVIEYCRRQKKVDFLRI